MNPRNCRGGVLFDAIPIEHASFIIYIVQLVYYSPHTIYNTTTLCNTTKFIWILSKRMKAYELPVSEMVEFGSTGYALPMLFELEFDCKRWMIRYDRNQGLSVDPSRQRCRRHPWWLQQGAASHPHHCSESNPCGPLMSSPTGLTSAPPHEEVCTRLGLVQLWSDRGGVNMGCPMLLIGRFFCRSKPGIICSWPSQPS